MVRVGARGLADGRMVGRGVAVSAGRGVGVGEASIGLAVGIGEAGARVVVRMGEGEVL